MRDGYMPDGRAERFEALVREHGDPREAARRFTGGTIAALARRAGVSRPQLNKTLGCYPGRRAPHVRRQLEAHLGMAPYALDPILDPIVERNEENGR